MKTFVFTLAAAVVALPLAAEDIDKEALAAEAARVQAEDAARQQAEEAQTTDAAKEVMLNLDKAPMAFVGIKPAGESYTYFWGDKELTQDEFTAALEQFAELNGKDGLAMQLFYNMDDITDDAAQALSPMFHDLGFVAVGLIAIPSESVDETFANLKKQPAVNAKLPE